MVRIISAYNLWTDFRLNNNRPIILRMISGHFFKLLEQY